MKKFTVLVKQVLMSTLTAGIFATGFASCSDEIENEANAFNGANTESLQVMNLEQYSYEVPVKVDIQGDWEIDIKFKDPANRFCYASPQKGHGPATIKLCMLDNWTEERNEGELIIRDLGNSSNDKTFRLMQKCNLDNPEIMNTKTRGGDGALECAANYSRGNRSKAVGYGYNSFASPSGDVISKNPIIALIKLEDNEEFDAGARTFPCASRSQHEFSGSSYEELYHNVHAETSNKISKGGFATEMKSSFTSTQKESSNHMFVYSTLDVKLVNAYIEGVDGNSIKDFLTDNAKAAINGEGAYSSTNEGFAHLVEDYGTHLVMSGFLGGHIHYATTVDKSLTEDAKEATAYAKLSYKNKIIDASSDLDAKLKKKYESSASKITTEVDSWGGTAKVLMDESSVDEWRKSLTVDNSVLVGLGDDDSDLIPLYDLVDDSTPAGKERKARMIEYFETGMAAVMAYDGTSRYITSDTYKVTIPAELAKADGKYTPEEGTLVYNVRGNNRWIAMICMEYIPQISNMGTVLVVYPVNNNKVDFANGRFLGNSMYPASRISWDNNGNCKITKDADNRNQENEFYMRGGSIFTKQPVGCDIVNTEIKPRYLENRKVRSGFETQLGAGYKRWEGYDFCKHDWVWHYDESWIEKLKFDDYNYPLIKIGNHIWTRENYTGNLAYGPNYLERYGTVISNGCIYFPPRVVKIVPLPTGWHAAKVEDFDNMKEVLSSDGYEKYGERLQKGGASGFDMEWTGWCSWLHREHEFADLYEGEYYYDISYSCKDEHHMNFMTPTGYNYYIKDTEMGRGRDHSKYDIGMQIRLVLND